MPATVRWLGLALLGILIAAGVSIAASRLASQQIGLASQPISAGNALVPHASPPPSLHRKHSQKTTPPRMPAAPSTPPATTTQPAPAPPTTIPASPTTPTGPSRSGGEGDHTGRGGGADD